MRRVLAIGTGAIVLVFIVIMVELLGPLLHPLPAGLRPGDPVATGAWLMSAPLAAQATIVLAWLLGGIAGGYVALRISQWRPVIWIIALFDLGMAWLTLSQFAHPAWMAAAALLVPVLAGWAAMRLDWAEDESTDARVEG